MTERAQHILNHASPADSAAKTGNVLFDLIAAWNNLVSGATNVVTSAPALAISGAGGTAAKTTAAFTAFVDGGVVSVAATTAMTAIAGTLADTKYAAWAFYVGPTGTISVSAKAADCTTEALAIAALPALPANVAQIGYITVRNAQGGGTAFTAGTTHLDATGIVTTYYNAMPVTLAITTLANR